MKTYSFKTKRTHGGIGSYQHTGHYLLVTILVLTFPFLLQPATAGMITFPWTVDLSIPAGTSTPDNPKVPPFEASYTAMDFYPPLGPDRIGLNFVSTHEHSYTMHLPFDISIIAPDEVSPGQTIFLDSSAVLSGMPSFTTQGSIEFNTELFADADSFTLGPPSEIGYGGVSLTVAGNESYTDMDNMADQKLTRTIWEYDKWGNPLQLNTAERFNGYELQTTGSEDAWGGELQILDFAANFIPPPVGTAVDVVAAVIDLTVGPEFNVVEDTYLQTQFATGFYTDDGGITYDDFLINGADRRGYLEIPDTLAPGDTYDIQMTAMGLGFTTLFEYFLQGNIDIELEILSGLFDVDIAEIPIGSAFLVDSWADRFQFVEFMNPDFGGFLDEDDFLAASLTFNVIGGLEDENPTLPPSGLEMGKIDPYIGDLLDEGADQGQQSYQFSGDPPSASAMVSAVPEPGTMLLLGVGLLGIAGVRRKLIK